MKNLILFGFFGASSWAGFNLSFTTTHRLNQTEKGILVEKEILSDLVLIPIYSGIDEYHEYVDLNEKTGITVLDEEKKGRDNWGNYNHFGFINLSSLRMKDNLAYMRHYPSRYVKTVILGVMQYFGPTTRWHPHDKLGSPHIPIREKIEPWENAYNSTLHLSSPFKKMGLYLLFVIAFVILLVKYLIDIIKWKTFNTNKKLIAFCVMNVFYVTALSCLVTFGELSRYRFMVEPIIWMMVLYFCMTFYKKIKYFAMIRKTVQG